MWHSLSLASLVVALGVGTVLPAAAGDLTLRRVMLSTGGVGYFEYAAEVDGATALGLDVPLGQVDDVLISLVVFDDAGGVGGVELPGRDAAAAAFANVPFGPEALATPAELLNSLQGVAVEVRGPRPMTGRIVRAEVVHEPVGPTVPPAAAVQRTRVSLLTEAGLQQFVLEDAESVQVSDPALRASIEHVLEAARREASQSRRHLTIRTVGQGKRGVHVGYVAGAPLWKATYRLVLPAGLAGKARLQGWAVLENESGTDWNGVALALQSGNPVTFRQAIYRAYYVQRPEVPVEVFGRLLPGVDTQARPMPAAAPMPAPPMAVGGAAARPHNEMMRAAVPPPPMAPAAAPAEASEGAEATVFTLANPVVLAAGHTASVPIADVELPGDRIGLVEEGHPHPTTAIRLQNTSGLTLPPGVLTLYDQGADTDFAGDARLGPLPAGQSRLLAFAEDLRTDVAWKPEQGVRIVGVTAARGTLSIVRRTRWTARITLTAPAHEERLLLVSIPRRGEHLVTEDYGGPVEQTDTAWRLTVRLAAGETRRLTAHVDSDEQSQVVVLDDPDVVAALVGEQALSEPARAALRHVAELRAAETARGAERDRLQTQLAAVQTDEERLRQNLAAVPANDALHTRLLRALDADETRIGILGTAIEQANAAVEQAHQALADAVAALRF
jgi:hypothetical protein